MVTIQMALKKLSSTQKLEQDAGTSRVVQLIFEGAVDDDATLAALTALQKLTKVVVEVSEPEKPAKREAAGRY